jgi:NMD protein affecting ribosome stability and mRNA decay
MGLFDSVYLACPKCGLSIEVQSKAGDCLMDSYSSDTVPKRIAVDIDGDDAYCEGCGTSWRVAVKKMKPVYKARLESRDA